ncbi:hypothetical protein [Kitasatospora sp. NPDC004531]
MSTESTGAAEPGAAAAVPSEPPAAGPAVEAPLEAPAEQPEAPAAETPETPETPETAAEAPEAPEAPEAFGQVETLAAGPEPARKQRKLSAGALFLTAVVAGPVIGAAVGYGIQASRPATPLPALVAPKLGYSAERVDAKALAAAGPQPLNIDGDLRALLIKRPDGSKDRTEGDGDRWMSVADQAETFGDSAETFSNLLLSGWRREATVSWSVDDVTYRIYLTQYAPESANKALAGMSPRRSDVDMSKIPGNDDSVVMVSKVPSTYARSTEQYYWAEALARKGTVLMAVEVFAKNPVDRSQLEDIAKRQWERLA